MTLLDEAALRHALARHGATLGTPLTLLAQTGSTSDDARQAAARGAPQGATFLADEQTSGRGRGGHRWHSPPGENLYLSVVLRPRVPPTAAAPISLVCGLAVATLVERALAPREDTAAHVAVKWPNDVLVNGRKIAGILVEGQIRGDTLQSLVVGIGLNVSAQRFPDELAARATSLALLGAQRSREELAAELLALLGHSVDRFAREGLRAFADELAQRDWLRGRNVAIGDLSGTACGIDTEGHLLIRRDTGEVRAIAAGEVSVRYDGRLDPSS
ncbi:biotin--[acetyl-CoA-carboxylase] ligase [Chondromyces crocatus]|uniref:biotin--[biotin carboxyl-carrier protein] ligase n=1 Tax=Chondromyces crocatus TaxID=52 RepID=A0A0K1EMK3_CHOCO|nr:biotin--[acetyl-CoA-carboxylase] ligase [Chondromyces crocatus]AKT41868.1 biotin--[acetyl-CoA-carboxylase] synthetase [Chondromyces crocatus]